MQSRGKIVVVIAFAFIFLGYQLLLHNNAISGHLTPISATLVLAPFAVALYLAIAAETSWRGALLLTSAVAMLTVAAAAIYGLPDFTFIYGMPHLIANLFLTWIFARTLKASRVPMITAIALRVHGSLADELISYTRRITLAWSLFFAFQVVGSLLLYRFASLNTWSIFINILDMPMVVLMFLCEYVYRVLRFPDHHSALLVGIKAYLKNKPTTKPTVKHG
jgi:uncharacterized membrane protein